MIRFANNPLITPRMLPDIEPHMIDVSAVFNPGVALYQDQVILLMRVHNRARESYLLKAVSDNGYHFKYAQQSIAFDGLANYQQPIYSLADPRITRIEDRWFMTLSLETAAGSRLGIAVTDNFEHFQFLGMIPNEDLRNGVLLPEKRRGAYQLLGNTGDKTSLVMYHSPDLISWDPVCEVAAGRTRMWDAHIGCGPAPMKTEKGWLMIYHGAAVHHGSRLYQAGVMLLDPEEPSRMIARGTYNILEPRESYEIMGQVPNVVFPTGWLPESVGEDGTVPLDARIRLYYGAADTTICLAHTTVEELLAAREDRLAPRHPLDRYNVPLHGG